MKAMRQEKSPILPEELKKLVAGNANRENDLETSEILKMESFKNLSEEQAAGLILVLKSYCQICFEVLAKQPENTSDQQVPVISMESINRKQQAA